jgi:hypothetical protein
MGSPTKRDRREYSPTEIDKALTVLAFYGGNAARASVDTNIPTATLKLWRSAKHRDRYYELAEREGPKLEAIGASNAREIVLRAAHAEHKILDSLDSDELTSKQMSELAGALQRISTSKGINTTKLLELTGRPTQVVQHLNPQQTIQALARDLGIVIDSTAEEIEPAALNAGVHSGTLVSQSATQTRESSPAPSLLDPGPLDPYCHTRSTKTL